jgi:hypothetical protein
MAGMLVALGGFGLRTGGAENDRKHYQQLFTFNFNFSQTFHFDELLSGQIFAGYRIDSILLKIFLNQPPLENGS